MEKENKIDAMYENMANWTIKNDVKNEEIKIAMELGFMEGWEKAIESTTPHLPLGAVSGSLPIEFLEWTEKGMWTKRESRTDGYHEMQGWYNTYNYAAMKQPLSSQELYDLFISERGGNDH